MEGTTVFLEKAKTCNLTEKIDAYQEEMIAQLGKLVQIPSLPTELSKDGMPIGPEVVRALHYALELSEQLGFQTHNEMDKYGWAEVGTEGPLVCIFTHLDIVEVGEGWTKEPFQLTREGNRLYGRGILDNKGPAIACLYALKACCDMGVEWPCRVRIWFGTNEENGMNDVQMYIHDYGAPDISFVPDSQFPLSYSELGTARFRIRKHYVPDAVGGDLKLVQFESAEHANGVPPAAKAVLEASSEAQTQTVAEQLCAFAQAKQMQMTAKTDGKRVEIQSSGKVAAHWNEPWTATNALAQLTMFLSTLSLGKEVDQLIGFVANKIGVETDGDSLGLKVTTETASLSMAMTAVGMDSFGMYFEFFMISPAEVRCEILFNTIMRQLRYDGMELVIKSLGPSLLRDKEMPLIQVLYASYSEVTGNTDPIKVCGGTYSKFVPNAIPFGAIFTPAQDLCHVPDEFIEISDLMIWSKIYANAILRICDNLDRLI